MAEVYDGSLTDLEWPCIRSSGIQQQGRTDYELDLSWLRGRRGSEFIRYLQGLRAWRERSLRASYLVGHAV